MSHVATVCSAPIVREARARGLDPAELVEGLDVRLEDLERPRGRVPWAPFVIFARRAADLLGTETLEELAAAATLDSVPRPIRRVLPRLRDSRPLFRLAARWWGPWVFRGTRGRCELLPDGRVREVVRILPGYAPCPEFLSGIQGTLRAMPRLLDQPDALVTFEQDGREGEYIITPPPARSRREKKSAPRIDALRHLGRALDRGGEPDALHQNIVRLLKEQRGVAGVRLESYDQRGGVREVVAGTTAGAPAVARPLRIADREIGQLQLWCVGERAPASLRELVPWIAFAVDYGRSRALVAQLLELLIEDVRDWERVERRLEQIAARCVDHPSANVEAARSTPGDPETTDLADFVYGMASRLHVLTGDEVQLALSCAEELPPAFGNRRELESFVAILVEILCDIGSEEIRIEARAVAEAGRAAGRRTTAELLVWGRGDELVPVPRRHLQTALDLAYPDLLPTVLGESGSNTAVGVRVRLPLRTLPASGRVH